MRTIRPAALKKEPAEDCAKWQKPFYCWIFANLWDCVSFAPDSTQNQNPEKGGQLMFSLFSPTTNGQANQPKPDYTHMAVILDRTGSMESIRDDTIGGFNAFLNEQKQQPGKATLTLVQFDSQDPYEVIHQVKTIKEVPELTKETYVPRATNSPAGCHRSRYQRSGEVYSGHEGGCQAVQGRVCRHYGWPGECQSRIPARPDPEDDQREGETAWLAVRVSERRS